jgi:hypothetical protein
MKGARSDGGDLKTAEPHLNRLIRYCVKGYAAYFRRSQALSALCG